MADATDLKSVIHWVCGFESRSGHHIKKRVLKTFAVFKTLFFSHCIIQKGRGVPGKTE